MAEVADKLLPAFNALGDKIMVPSGSVKELQDKGGRLATAEDLKAPDNLGTIAGKVAGAAAALSPLNAATGLAAPIISGITKGVVHSAAPNLAAVEQKNRDAGGLLAAGQGFADSQGANELGVTQGLTAGLGAGAIRQALGAVSKDAGKAYEDWATTAKESNPLAYGFGNVAGLAGGLAAGGVTPAGLIGKAGGAVEGLAARGLAGLAEGGALARAGAAGLRLGAQGAVEGALYAGAEHIGEDMLGDHELNAEKLFAAMGHGGLYGGLGGAALGAGGSLAMSGLKAGAGGLARVLSKGKGAVSKMESTSNDLAWRSLGGTRKAARLAEEFPGGTGGVGEVLHKYGVLDAADKEAGVLRSAWEAGKAGRADEILPRLSAAKDAVGAKLGELTNSGELVPLIGTSSIYKDLGAIRSGLEKSLTGREAIPAFDRAWDGVHAVLAERGAIGEAGVAAKEIIAVRKQLDDLIYESRKVGASTTQEALKAMRNTLEDHALDAIEAGAQKAGGSVKSKLLGLKKDYRALAIAEKAAETGAERVAGNNQFGLRESLGAVGAIASGNILAAPALALGGKILRERGEAAASVMLKKLANMEAVQQAIAAVDAQVTRSAKGLIEPKAVTSSSRVASLPPKAAARQLAKEVQKAQADPEGYANRIGQQTADLARLAPKTAGALAGVMTRSSSWVAQQSPQSASQDPLAPMQRPTMSDTEALKFVRRAEAARNPMKVLADIENGRINQDQIDALKETSPRLFALLQLKTMGDLTERVAKGETIPYAARMRLGLVLDVPTDASLRPETMRQLQQNVLTPTPGPDSAPAPMGGGRKVNLQLPPVSTFDRLETGMKGRRS